MATASHYVYGKFPVNKLPFAEKDNDIIKREGKGEMKRLQFFFFFFFLFEHVQLRAKCVNYCWGSDVWGEAGSQDRVISVSYGD